MASSSPWFVIINPTSGNGKSNRVWPKIEWLLKAHQFDFQFTFTSYPKHSIAIVHKAIQKGIVNFISIGGDGTLHNIINGVMTQHFVEPDSVTLGIIPIGTGNDWVKTYNIPKRIEDAIRVIRDGKISKQDIGKIEFVKENKAPVYFNNLAGVGFDGCVVSKVQKYKRYGALAYLIGALISMFSFKNFNSKTTVNSNVVSGKTLMVLIGVCTYSGGGMRLTKTPNPSDELFDISIAQNLSKFEIIKNLNRLFNGKITNHKKVQSFKSRSVIIETDLNDNPPYVQADGELLGKGNIRVTLVPNAFTFYCNVEN